MSEKNSLQYIRNTNGGATIATFVDDHAPLGEILWEALTRRGWVEADANSRIYLTAEGNAVLDAPETEETPDGA